MARLEPRNSIATAYVREVASILMDTTQKPAVTVPDAAPPTELVIDDLVEGDGPEATAGGLVTVD